MEVDEVSDGLTEFNMDNYDEEDDGMFSFCLSLLYRTEFFHIDSNLLFVAVLDLDIQLFSSGIWDLYYPSNELDPTRFL